MAEKLWQECPECGSDDFDSWNSKWEYDGDHAELEVECLDCGCIWKWVYNFSHSQIVVSGGRSDEDFGEDTTSGSPADLLDGKEDD